MTVAVAQIPEVAYVGDGSATSFSRPFTVPAGSTLAVTLDGTLTTAYAVVGANVVFTAPPAVGVDIVLRRLTPLTQAQAFPDDESVTPGAIEDGFDKRALVEQELLARFNRTVHFPPGEASAALPGRSERAGRLWACDGAGDLVFVPGIDNASQIDDLLYAKAYYDTNDDGFPRLMLDVEGQGDTPMADIANPGGLGSARIAMQARDPGGDHSLSGLLWLQGVFENWTEASKPTDKRSKYTATIGAVSKIDGVPWDIDPRENGTDGPVILGQEVGALYLQAVIDNNVTNGKAEGLVCFAKQNPRYDKNGVDQGAVGQGKCVGGQFGTVMAVAGPVADDKTQMDTDDEDAATFESELEGTPGDAAEVFNEPQGGFTIRANGAGVFRSWAAFLGGGRAGHFNGVVFNKPKSGGSPDADGIYGVKGVWGGRSFWQKETVALYAKDSCPGWATFGWDGIARAGHIDIGIPNAGDSGARAPVDIVVDTGAPPANWTGAVLMFNGVRLLGNRSTGWTAMTGTPSKAAMAAAAAGAVSASYVQAEAQASRNRIAALEARLAAYDAMLFAHGLIGA